MSRKIRGRRKGGRMGSRERERRHAGGALSAEAICKVRFLEPTPKSGEWVMGGVSWPAILAVASVTILPVLPGRFHFPPRATLTHMRVHVLRLREISASLTCRVFS